jgi:hypothetical protein
MIWYRTNGIYDAHSKIIEAVSGTSKRARVKQKFRSEVVLFGEISFHNICAPLPIPSKIVWDSWNTIHSFRPASVA